MEDACGTLPVQDFKFTDVDYLLGRINETMYNTTFYLDFFSWAEICIKKKTPPTRGAYIQAINALARFIGKRKLDINSITKLMMLDFIDYIDAEPKLHYSPKLGKVIANGTKPKGASTRHIMKLAHIYNLARERFNDEDSNICNIPRNPFAHLPKFYPISQGQRGLSFELMQQIILAQTNDRGVRNALDAFIVSFALMGANLADLYFATPPGKGVWVYNRQKTKERRADKARMVVAIPDEIMPFVQRLRDGEEGSAHWWLPALHRIGAKKDTCLQQINGYLRRWQGVEGVQDFTFYAARHTWAMLCRNAGVDVSTIHDCLCHKDKLHTTRIYTPVNWELVSQANRKVLSLFRWS